MATFGKPRHMVLVELDSSAVDALQANGAHTRPEAFAQIEGLGALLLYSCAAPARSAGITIHTEMLFARGRYGRRAGSHLFRVGLRVPWDFRDEFLAWYEIEHLPILLQCAQWDGCRFVEAASSESCQFYALHQLKSPDALDSPQRKASRSTPWFRRLAQHVWFDAPFTRVLYRRVD